MISRLNPRSRRDAYGSKINRAHSPLLAHAIPWGSILLGSLVPLLPIISSAPVVPPMGFVLMVTWRLLRPGLLPLWAGVPLGAFDDLFSGQPFGSGILLFSMALFVIELLEDRLPWRGFWQDWLTAAVVIAAYLAAAAMLSGTAITVIQLTLILPQLLMSVLLFPLFARFVALLDRLRLLRVRKLG
ncbi:rod shape-determining protein MreD [Altericroceibacterium xinjiangense]|uniref:rod shape-determining protein MreD n=1 Tax=Altericroceibacterium xinjiangense TaxID=762261 RepID=UPI0013E05947|nr:rod shape-determining protein MreD [Altericroceibacterium xinjiangense]